METRTAILCGGEICITIITKTTYYSNFVFIKAAAHLASQFA